MDALWLNTHLFCAIGADLFMLAAGVLALLYLWQDFRLRHKMHTLPRGLPSINTLDDWGNRFFCAAFLLMTAGMLAGSVMARQMWGARWFLDARQVWSVMVWLLFASVLIARFLAGWRGRRASWISVVGIAFMLLGHVGLAQFTSTKHRLSFADVLLLESGEQHER